MSGGVAKNVGVVEALQEKLGAKFNIAFEPQIVGAVGAALIALEKVASYLSLSNQPRLVAPA